MKLPILTILQCCLLSIGLIANSAFAQTPAVGSADKAQSAVVAIVDGEDITAADLDLEANPKLQGITDPLQIQQIKAAVLNDLINQALVMQAANKSGLATNPEAVKLINQWQKKALFSFYLNNQIGKLPTVDEKMVDEFIHKHPELIDKHKTYHYNQLFFPVSEKASYAKISDIWHKEGTSTFGTLDDIKAYLRANKVASIANNLWRGSEQIQAQTLDYLNKLKPGEMKVILSPDQKSIEVLKLVDSYPDPIAVEEARIPIMRGIQGDMRDSIVQGAIATLRSKASIRIPNQELSDGVLKVQKLSSALVTPMTLLNELQTAWYFMLLVLTPVVAVMFYRQYKPKKVLEKKKVNVEISGADPIFNVSILALRIPFLLLLSYWLLVPMVEFFANPPMWVTLHRLTLLAFAGMGGAIAIILVSWKIAPIGKHLKKAWLALLILVLLRIAFTFIK